MNERAQEGCRMIQEDLWASWPNAGAVPEPTLSHARSCLACAKELEALRDFSGRVVAWSGVLPSSYWAREALAARRALAGPPAARRSLLWAPAMALAIGAAMFLVRRPEVPAPKPDVPIEAVEKHLLLENLDLLERWDEAAAAAAENRP